MDIEDMGLDKKKSVDNAQYNMNDLIQKIISETK